LYKLNSEILDEAHKKIDKGTTKVFNERFFFWPMFVLSVTKKK